MRVLVCPGLEGSLTQTVTFQTRKFWANEDELMPYAATTKSGQIALKLCKALWTAAHQKELYHQDYKGKSTGMGAFPSLL